MNGEERPVRTRSTASLLVAATIAGALPAGARAAEPFPIDAILSLTGNGAFLGQGQQSALVIAEQAINESGGIGGRPVAFRYHDDQSNPQVAVQLATEIVASAPSVMLGSSLVASCRAIAPLVKTGPVDYCLTPGFHPDPGSYVFSSAVSTYDQITVAVRYFRLEGWKRLAFLVSTDATGQDAESGLKDTLALPENKDMQLVTLAHFNASDVSVAAQIETIKAADPQCLLVWTTGTPVATAFRAILDAGLAVPTGTTGGNMTYRQMEQYASFMPHALYFGSTEWVVRDHALLQPIEVAAHDEFYKAFVASGKKPDVSSELAWDPAMIVVGAFRALGPGATAAQLHDYIAHLKNHAGINGIYDFEARPQRGVGGSDSVVVSWSQQAGTWQVMSKPGGIPLQR
jgi:branched-chain amino acid transport system substrate-binding protein